jgi:hypothetical protein
MITADKTSLIEPLVADEVAGDARERWEVFGTRSLVDDH